MHPARRREVGRRRQQRRRATSAIADGNVNPIHEATPPKHPRPARPDRDPELAARRPGQRLAEREEVGELAVVEPVAPLDVLAPEVADVGDRAAERGQPEPERGAEHLAETRRSGSGAAHPATVHGLSASRLARRHRPVIEIADRWALRQPTFEAPTMQIMSQPTTAQPASTSSGRPILVVDDDAKIVRLVRTYLERAGYRVVEAADGRAALAAIAARDRRRSWSSTSCCPRSTASRSCGPSAGPTRRPSSSCRREA